jgi:hypothetical protein
MISLSLNRQHRNSFGDVAATMGVVGPRESSYKPDEKTVPDEPNIAPPVLQVRNRIFCAPFYAETDRFAKTGSGQT